MKYFKMSYRNVRNVGLGLLVALIVVTSILGIYNSSRMAHHINELSKEDNPELLALDNLTLDFIKTKDLLAAFIIKEQVDIKPLINKTNNLKKNTESLISLFHQERHRQLLKEFNQKLKIYSASLVDYYQELSILKTGEGVRAWERALMETEGEAYSLLLELKKNLNEEVSRHLETSSFYSKKSRQLSIFFGLIGIIFGSILALVLKRAIARPVEELVHASMAVAKGDLRPEIGKASDDEIGSLSRSLAVMVYNLRLLVQKIKNTSLDIRTSTVSIDGYSEEVSKGAELQSREIENISSSVKKLDTIINEISTKVRTLSESLEDSSSSSEELASSIKEISGSADKMFSEVETITSSLFDTKTNMGEALNFAKNLSSLSRQASDGLEGLTTSITKTGGRAEESRDYAENVNIKSKEAGSKAIAKMLDINRRNKELVDNYSHVIQSLGAKSDDVEQILDVIRDVADQTNLLSLNAAIIANQAGEHGRSFSVVAGQMGKLSNATSENVKQIEDVIGNVQKELGKAVKLISDIVAGMDTGIESALKTGEVLKEIENLSSLSVQMSVEISKTVTDQVSWCNEILKSVKNNSLQVDRINEVMEEQKRGLDLIVNSVENIRLHAEHLKLSTKKQFNGSTIISKTIDETHIFSEDIRKIVRGEKESSRHIVDSLNRISEIAGTNLKAMEKLDKMVKDFGELEDRLSREMAPFKLPD